MPLKTFQVSGETPYQAESGFRREEEKRNMQMNPMLWLLVRIAIVIFWICGGLLGGWPVAEPVAAGRGPAISNNNRKASG